MTRQGRAGLGRVRCGVAGHGKAWLGMVWYGMAGRGLARQGSLSGGKMAKFNWIWLGKLIPLPRKPFPFTPAAKLKYESEKWERLATMRQQYVRVVEELGKLLEERKP